MTINSKMDPDVQAKLEALLDLFPDIKIAAYKTFHKPKVELAGSFDVIVTSYDGEFVAKFSGVSEASALRIKKAHHKLGNRVNQIEISSLSGNVVRTLFIPPETHISQVSDKPVVSENKYRSHTTASTKFHDEFFAKANAELKKGYETKNNSKILIYKKITGQLSFSGNLIEAIEFMRHKSQNGGWNTEDWVIYLPSKICNKVK